MKKQYLYSIDSNFITYLTEYYFIIYLGLLFLKNLSKNIFLPQTLNLVLEP